LSGKSGLIMRHSKSVKSYRLMPTLNQILVFIGSVRCDKLTR
jgi:hypothetical protein